MISDNKAIVIQMKKTHWQDVKRIYQLGLETGYASLETTVPQWSEWTNSHLHFCRFVAKMNNEVVGWSALSKVSERYVYRGVAEISIYVDPEYHGKGIGSNLMEKTVTDSEINGIWTLQALIFPENRASIKLHEKFGFRLVGIRERIGKRDNHWRNVALYERRSKRVGIE